MVESLQYVQGQNLRCSTFLTTFLGDDRPSPNLSFKMKRWKHTPQAAALVEAMTYDACLSRAVCTSDKVTNKLAMSYYLRSPTGRLTEEDNLKYSPQEAIQ